MQQKVIKRSGGHRVSRFLHAKNDKDVIAGWKSRLLHVFDVSSALLFCHRWLSPSQTELAMNTHTIVADMRQDVLKIREDADNQNRVSDTRFLYTWKLPHGPSNARGRQRTATDDNRKDNR